MEQAFHIFLSPLQLCLSYGNQLHQLAGQCAHTAGFLLDDPGIFHAALLRNIPFNLQQVGKTKDGGEGRLHFMGKVINELFPILCHIL